MRSVQSVLPPPPGPRLLCATRTAVGPPPPDVRRSAVRLRGRW